MLKRILKLAVAALIVHAAWRIGAEYLTFYQFRDAVRQDAARGNPSADQLRRAVFVRAEEFDVPIDEDSVVVERDERRAHLEGSYVREIELLPRYFYPWTFRWTVEVFVTPDLDAR
jgi:hypothetical protein